MSPLDPNILAMSAPLCRNNRRGDSCRKRGDRAMCRICIWEAYGKPATPNSAMYSRFVLATHGLASPLVSPNPSVPPTIAGNGKTGSAVYRLGAAGKSWLSAKSLKSDLIAHIFDVISGLILAHLRRIISEGRLLAWGAFTMGNANEQSQIQSWPGGKLHTQKSRQDGCHL